MTTTKRKNKPVLPTGYLEAVEAERRHAHVAPAPEVAPSPPAMSKATFYVPGELLDELRAASWTLAGAPLYLAGPSELVVQALSEKLAALAKAHNKGKPFATSGAPTKARRGNPRPRQRAAMRS